MPRGGTTVSHSIGQRLLAAAAVLFGIATIAAGTRVVLGADPGYSVYGPLLAYNTGMGAAYVAAGLAAWSAARRGARAAAAIFVLNGLVLGAVVLLYVTQGSVALESVRAMTLRTVVWLGLWLGLAWLGRQAGGHRVGDRGWPARHRDRPPAS